MHLTIKFSQGLGRESEHGRQEAVNHAPVRAVLQDVAGWLGCSPGHCRFGPDTEVREKETIQEILNDQCIRKKIV